MTQKKKDFIGPYVSLLRMQKCLMLSVILAMGVFSYNRDALSVFDKMDIFFLIIFAALPIGLFNMLGSEETSILGCGLALLALIVVSTSASGVPSVPGFVLAWKILGIVVFCLSAHLIGSVKDRRLK